MATSCAAFIQNPASLGILTKVAIRSSFRRLASGKGCDENEVIVMFCVFNCVNEDKLSTTFAHIVQPKHLFSLLRAIDHVVQDSNASWAEGGVCGFNPKSELVES
nr:hypothetical protein L203_03243 [Cryptococcus depauperatus CBS 7841]